MSTQDTNPVADLMNSLGIGVEDTTTDESSDENLTLSSEEATQDMDAEPTDTLEETDTPEGDTETADDIDYASEVEKLKAELDKANKRISDKDKYINELRNPKQEGNEEAKEELPQEPEEDFWDNPEGIVTNLKNEVLNLRNELAEQRYAATKSDYWEHVKSEEIKDALNNDATFADGLKDVANPYEYAYNYFKSKHESKAQAETATREELKKQLRAELMEEMKMGNKKETPPSMRNVGKSTGSSNTSNEDGFAAVFGSQY